METLADKRTYHEAQSSMELLPNYYEWTYSKFRKFIGGNVIELGCGSGTGIQCYLERAQHVYAVDYSSELLERVGRSFDKDKVTPIQADLTNDWHELEGVEADIVILMDVLEHFRDDKTFLEKAASHLKPGGKLAIKVPAQSSLYSSVDEASGHFRRYDPDDLYKLAPALGLECRFIRHINPLGAVAYRMKKKNKTSFSGTFSNGQLKMLNRLMPLIRLADFVPLLPGMSMVCVMDKPVEGQIDR